MCDLTDTVLEAMAESMTGADEVYMADTLSASDTVAMAGVIADTVYV